MTTPNWTELIGEANKEELKREALVLRYEERVAQLKDKELEFWRNLWPITTKELQKLVDVAKNSQGAIREHEPNLSEMVELMAAFEHHTKRIVSKMKKTSKEIDQITAELRKHINDE